MEVNVFDSDPVHSGFGFGQPAKNAFRLLLDRTRKTRPPDDVKDFRERTWRG
jgi:hypothetical protein